jgi:hypothetical protein
MDGNLRAPFRVEEPVYSIDEIPARCGLALVVDMLRPWRSRGRNHTPGSGA